MEESASRHSDTEFASYHNNDTHASLHEDATLQAFWDHLMAGSEFDTPPWQTGDFLSPEFHINTAEPTTASATVDQLRKTYGSDTSTMAGLGPLPGATHFGSAVVTSFLTPHVHHSDCTPLSVTAHDLERSISLQGPTQGTFGGSLFEILPGELMYGTPSLGAITHVPIETPATSASGSPSS